DSDAQQESTGHPHEAVVREERDPLIHLPAFFQRLQNVDLALFPGLHRRWKVRDHRAGRPPDDERQDDSNRRQEKVGDAFHDTTLWMGNDVAYFSGSAASRVLSNNVTLVCSVICLFTPSSFIASR